MPFETLNFGDHKFLLYPNGELYWSDKKIVIVSDLHLEKRLLFMPTQISSYHPMTQ